LCNHCCSGKSISITYSECVYVALGIQHVMHMHHIVIYGLSGSTTFFLVISLMPRLLEKKFIDHKICVYFLYNFGLIQWEPSCSKQKDGQNTHDRSNSRFPHCCDVPKNVYANIVF